MSHRINQKDLELVLHRINTATGQALEGWTKQANGRYRANVGTYILDYAYGGVRLAQLCTEGGGETDLTGLGTKRETYHRMHAFLRGVATPEA
tara:strand:+ start:77 stop:355 length:279 start_codon:yes stop_codon:yes gene_type:complete